MLLIYRQEIGLLCKLIADEGGTEMGAAQENASGIEIQMGVFESITDLLVLKLVCFLGFLIIGVLLVALGRKKQLPTIKIWIASLGLYYYLCLMLNQIVGIPTRSEFVRLSGLGESFFHPKFNLIPFYDVGILSFVLNIILFIPFGFLCPVISGRYRNIRNMLLLGAGFSAVIEFSQMFTLNRVTDINDLLTNILGTAAGYLCYRFIAKRTGERSVWIEEKEDLAYLPVMIVVTAYLICFLS